MLRSSPAMDLTFFGKESKPHRQIILDTETTGLFPKQGDRIVEISCIEMIDNKPTGKYYQQYINPERDSNPGAFKVHGLTTEFLSKYPKFSEITDQFLAFVNGADLIIHNAPFDIEFINRELEIVAKSPIEKHCKNIIDTKIIAQELYSREALIKDLLKQKLIDNDEQIKNLQAKNISSEEIVNEIIKNEKFRAHSLDNLCKYFGIALNKRDKHHGALIDCELLSQVYVCLLKEKNLRDEQHALKIVMSV